LTSQRDSDGTPPQGADEVVMGLVPAGTANLLARNLDVPLQEAAAIEVAVTGTPRTIDLIKITVDDRDAPR